MIVSDVFGGKLEGRMKGALSQGQKNCEKQVCNEDNEYMQ